MSTVRRLAFADVESTGLEPEEGHESWEYGLVIREPDGAETLHRYFVRPQRMDLADPEALEIGRFAERTAGVRDGEPGHIYNLADGHTPPTWSDPVALAEFLEDALRGAVLIGSNVQFDQRMIREAQRRQGRKLTCHYRPVDVGAMAFGYLQGRARVDRWLAHVPLLGRWARVRLAALEAASPGALSTSRRRSVSTASASTRRLPDAAFARDVHDLVRGLPLRPPLILEGS